MLSAFCCCNGVSDAAPIDGYLAIANVIAVVVVPSNFYDLDFAVVFKVIPITNIMYDPSLCNPIMEVPLPSSVCY
jgi:hypothetical protein